MSYNQKQPSGNSGMGGAGPPNGPNNPQQMSKTLAGFQQQMQNFVHGQNALPSSSQADLGAFFQQQRFQSMLKQQQQQFLQQHFQQQMQQQQQQHQQQQNKDRTAGTEPLALTRTPAAAELLNKTYQQHHQQHPNGNPVAPNPATLNQLQQLQVLSPNIMHQLQAFQLQMQQHQQQQQQQQHHSQTQPVPPPPGPLPTLPQQQLHSQSSQQQKAALSTAASAAAAVAAAQFQQRYLSVQTAAAAAAQATGMNKVGVTSPPPPPLTTNQIKSPNLPTNLPPSTQITPVPANSSGTTQSSLKSSTANSAAVSSSSKQVSVPPSISLLPTKAPITAPTTTPSSPVAAHQQNKFNVSKQSSSSINASTASPSPAHMQKPTSSSSSMLSSISNSVEKISKPAATPQPAASKTSQKNATIPSKPSPTTTPSPDVMANKTLPPVSSPAILSHTQQIPIKSHGSAAPQIANKTVEPDTQKNDSSATTQAPPATKSSSSTAENKTSAVNLEEAGKSNPDPVADKTKLNLENSISNQSKQAKVEIALSSNQKNESSVTTSKEVVEEVVNKEKSSIPAKSSAKPIGEDVPPETISKPLSQGKREDESVVKPSTVSDNNAPKELPSSDKEKTISSEKAVQNEKHSSKCEKNDTQSVEKNPSKTPKGDVEIEKKPSEVKEISVAKPQEQKVEPLKITKLKESPKIEETKSSKVEATEKATPEALSTKTSSSTVKDLKEDENESRNENPSLKKTSRQQKIVSATSNTPLETKKSSEKLEKATSSKNAREEKRQVQKLNANVEPPSGLSTPTSKESKESSASISDRKSQRHRLKTILYQSPLPELAFITKLSASEASNSPKPTVAGEDKLIVFYKNEYMAVRNAEGTFYLCQTLQNVYRTSPRISIRWLSEDAKDNTVYIPDFYDHTDIECVLTTVDLKRVDKGHLRLPETEKVRIENILKKAIDVEKGLVPRPELTEENPDGLDISLYKDESQIEKKISAQTPVSSGRNSRRSTSANAGKSSQKATTPSKAAGSKRKATSATNSSSAKKSKSPAKKRKTATKRKVKRTNMSDEDDNDSSEEDQTSDAEYRPTQKKSNTTPITKSSPRMQRSPLAKTRVVSPLSASARSKNIVEKASASTPVASRAIKRNASANTDGESPIPSTKKSITNFNTGSGSADAIKISKSVNLKSKEAQESGTTTKKPGPDSNVSSTSTITATTATSESDDRTANGSSSSSSSSRPTRSRK